MPIITVENLSKDYKYYEHGQGLKGAIKSLFNREYKCKNAVRDISFSIEEGEIVGYLGSNGAGKSTTIKMLTGIIVPTNGKVEVMGMIPSKDRIKNASNIGVVFGQRTQLWWDIPLIESFNLNKYLYKIKPEEYEKRLNELINILDMQKFINMPVRQLSLGQRMRGDLCMALLHNPKVLYLDEPTIGLDVVVKENIRELIKKINQEYNTTIILTTHDMGDVEKLCTRVIAIDSGVIIYDGSVNRLKSDFGSEEKIVFEAKDEIDIEKFKSISGSIKIKKLDKKCEIVYDCSTIAKADIITIINRQFDIKDIDIVESDLESIIKKLYDSNCINASPSLT